MAPYIQDVQVQCVDRGGGVAPYIQDVQVQCVDRGVVCTV